MHRRDPQVVGGSGSDGDALARRQVDETMLADESEQVIDDLLRGRHHLAALRVVVQHVAPDVEGRPLRVHARGGCGELPLHPLQFALTDREQRRRRNVDQFLGAVARLNIGGADRVAAGGGGKRRGFELGRVAFGCLARGAGRGAQLDLQRLIRHVRERQKQVAGQQIRDAPKHDGRALDEHPRRRADVGARRGQ